MKQKLYYDKNAKDLCKLSPGSTGFLFDKVIRRMGAR
jgi:hypothetical protein